MIGRILWIAVLLGIAAVTTGLQLDRQSEADPALAPLVPAPFRNSAQIQLAAEAFKQGDPAKGLAEAEALVRVRPMPAEHLTLLAAAQARAGEAEAADYSIGLAARRGWREPVAQEAMLRYALANGDKAEAARRFAALLRNNATSDEMLTSFAPQVFAETGGAARQTFADVLAGAPRWYEQYLQRGARVMPPAAFSEVLALSLERGAQYPCDQLKAKFEELNRSDPAAAATLAAPVARRCP